MLEKSKKNQQKSIVISSAIKLAHKPVYHARSKHIELQPHFAREETKYKEIELVYFNTSANVVDIFTNRVGDIHF